MSNDHARRSGSYGPHAGGDRGVGPGGLPGKRTLTESLPQGGGAPLPAETRAKFEKSLGADLANVRLHTDGRSAEAARSVGAHAFTLGSNVHFGAGASP